VDLLQIDLIDIIELKDANFHLLDLKAKQFRLEMLLMIEMMLVIELIVHLENIDMLELLLNSIDQKDFIDQKHLLYLYHDRLEHIINLLLDRLNLNENLEKLVIFVIQLILEI